MFLVLLCGLIALILSLGIWFGVWTLLVWVLSLTGLIEFNIFYAVAATIITIIIQMIIKSVSNKKDD